MKKKTFWIRTGFLVVVLLFAVLGGNLLYTGVESASPLDMLEDSVPLSDGSALVQVFSPAHSQVTSIALALRAPDPLTPDAMMSGLPDRMTADSGDLTVTLTDHADGACIYTRTVSLAGVPEGWYLDFPVNCRLDTNAQYDLCVSVENNQESRTPSLFTVPQSAQLPEITGDLTATASVDDTGTAGKPSDFPSGAAAIRLTYDVLVPARLAVFLAVLAVTLSCTAATAFFSHKKTENGTKDLTLGKLLAVRIHKIPLIHILFFAAVTITAVILRIAFFPVKCNDYYIAYEVWINEIRSNGGLASLGMDIGDNPPLYMTLITLTSYLPFAPVVIVKLPSVIFDFILALVCVKLCGQLGVTPLHKKLLLYAVILLNPLTLLDSAAWGQCDSLYGSMILLSLLAICGAKLWSTETPPPVGRYPFWRSGDGICLLFAVAISLKLQAIFFLPILCLLWIMQKRSVLKPVQLLWVPIVYTISCIPMYLAGRSLKVMFRIYLGQADRNYGTLTLNYPNLYHLIGTWSEELYDSYFIYGLLLTFLLLLALFYQLYCRKVKLDGLTLCKVTALSILTICFCLPLVHERYAYVAEMLLFVIMIKEPKHIKTALATMLCTLFTYCTYLMQLEQSFTVLPEPVISLIRLGVICYLTGDIFQKKQQKTKWDR
ncbi:MAG: hypothetical protein NC420_09105 [Eubacterium sp.]|nr:hypothetical protein [Eubacterium sp.]